MFLSVCNFHDEPMRAQCSHGDLKPYQYRRQEKKTILKFPIQFFPSTNHCCSDLHQQVTVNMRRRISRIWPILLGGMGKCLYRHRTTPVGWDERISHPLSMHLDGVLSLYTHTHVGLRISIDTWENPYRSAGGERSSIIPVLK